MERYSWLWPSSWKGRVGSTHGAEFDGHGVKRYRLSAVPGLNNSECSGLVCCLSKQGGYAQQCAGSDSQKRRAFARGTARSLSFMNPEPTNEPALEASLFWEEVRKRRNHCFLAAASWLVLGLPLVLLYSTMLPAATPSIVPGTAALVTWCAFSWWVGNRLAAIRCFRCGKQAFAHALFFMRHARCKNCGVAYER